ncbi:hypothetical protein CH305_07275 [Rhodococcus sp. 15-649-2-2]|nr:hypothetical protein CH305_07275 [Rhodococcus sp. 15-649-2-2]
MDLHANISDEYEYVAEGILARRRSRQPDGVRRPVHLGRTGRFARTAFRAAVRSINHLTLGEGSSIFDCRQDAAS